MSVALTVTGPNVPCQIHRQGCADIRASWAKSGESWNLSVDSWEELAENIWGEPVADSYEWGSAEWRADCVANMTEYRVMPCCPEIPIRGFDPDSDSVSWNLTLTDSPALSGLFGARRFAQLPATMARRILA